MTTQVNTRAGQLPTADKLNITGILCFGAMIVVQIAGGMDNYPTIPPGLVISLLVVGLLVVGARWRWTRIAGAAWPVLLVVGAVLASDSLGALSGDDGVFVQITSIVQRLFLAVALIAGVVALVRAYRSSKLD